MRSHRVDVSVEQGVLVRSPRLGVEALRQEVRKVPRRRRRAKTLPVDHDDVSSQIEEQIVEPEVAVHDREGTPGEADATLIAKFASRRPEALASARRAGSYVREVAFYRELPCTPTAKVENYKLRERGLGPTTWDLEPPRRRVRRDDRTHRDFNQQDVERICWNFACIESSNLIKSLSHQMHDVELSCKQPDRGPRRRRANRAGLPNRATGSHYTKAV